MAWSQRSPRLQPSPNSSVWKGRGPPNSSSAPRLKSSSRRTTLLREQYVVRVATRFPRSILMSPSDTPSSIRTCAARMIRTIEAWEQDHDNDKLRRGLLESTLPVTRRADLYKLGTKRQANHIENAKWLY